MPTSHQEVDLELALERDNPKGRLWEACAKRRITTPTIAGSTAGDRHRVQMGLTHGEWELDSGVHWAPTRKLAEHLASRALLEELDALERDEPALRPTPPVARAEHVLGDEDLFDVSPEDVARHRLSNPKGQLLEWCQRQRPPVKRPRFETRTLGGAQIARVRLETLDVESPWFRARRRPEAAQAAAEALLGLLPREGSDDALETANPRDLLDRLVKAGELLECSVEIVGERGPAHARVFVAEGRARHPSGTNVRQLAEASTKREAIRGAARKLLDTL